MSGGVRNLRAMFENKDESATSPPDRGRSPAGSIGGGSNGTSPRPLSKVRTSFVAVERSGQLGGQWGLRKESSASNTDPSLATRRTSFSIDEESNPKEFAERKESIKSEISARKASTAVTEIIPETAVETPPAETEKKTSYINGKSGQGKAAPAVSKPSGSPDKKTGIEEKNAKLLPGDSTSSAAVSGGAALNHGGGFGETLNGSMDGRVKQLTSVKAIAKPNPDTRSSRPNPIATVSTSTTKSSSKPAKSPAAPKTPTTPGKSTKASTLKTTASTSAVPAKTLEKKASKPALSAGGTSKPAGRPSTSSTSASITENKVSQSSPGGFHKPRPKSPTRPAKLPASLTAPTSSSLSKVSITAASSSRRSLAPSIKPVSRSPSRSSLAPKTELKRKPSSLTNDRPALGRPLTSSIRKQPSRQSLSKSTAPADESFLARMMRPTNSSAAKTAEKIVTPPRKSTVAQPTTRDGPSKPYVVSKGSPSSKSLPVAAKGSKAEDLKPAALAQAGEPLTEAAGNLGAEPAIVKDVEDVKGAIGQGVPAPTKPAEEAPAATEEAVAEKLTLEEAKRDEALTPSGSEAIPEKASPPEALEEGITAETPTVPEMEKQKEEIASAEPVPNLEKSDLKNAEAAVPNGIVDESKEEEEGEWKVEDSEPEAVVTA